MSSFIRYVSFFTSQVILFTPEYEKVFLLMFWFQWKANTMFITPTHLTSVISDFFQYLALILLTCSYTVPKSVCLPAYCLCDISDLFSTPIAILSSNSHHLVTNLVLLATQQANKSRDKLLEQGIMTLCGSQQTEKMVD